MFCSIMKKINLMGVEIVTKLLIKWFMKNEEDVITASTRTKYGYLGACVGIGSNIFLFFVKFIIGILINSIAVTADAFNNLSDVASSVVTLIGFKLTAKPADEDHPFGHGRAEYLAGLIVAAIILLVGVELGKSSIEKIKNPAPIEFSVILLAILVLSVGVKLWQSRFNATIGKKINSKVLQATAADSMNDVIATSVVILSIIASKFISFPIDGYMGLGVAGFILFSGYNIMKDTIDPLLGQPAEPEVVEAITKRILSFDGIIGIHDLVIHNYGPGRCMATAHAEMPADYDIMAAHEIMDDMEKAISKELGVFIVMHLDPVSPEDEETILMREVVSNIIGNIDGELSFHDFRMVKGDKHTNIIFDIIINNKYNEKSRRKELYQSILGQIKSIDDKYELVVEFDRKFS